jgi:hypothetical protein
MTKKAQEAPIFAFVAVLADGVAAGGVNSLNVTGGVAELVEGRVGVLSTFCVCEGKDD